MSEVQGTTQAGEVLDERPVLVAGIDPDGKVRAVRVDADGVPQYEAP